MKSSFSFYSILYFFIILYAVSTMTQDLIPFIPLNRICYLVIFVSTLIILLKKIKFRTFISLFIVIVDLILVHLVYNVSEYILDYIYFITSLVWLLFLMNEERRKKLLNEFQKHEGINKFTIIFSIIIVVFCLVTKTGYKSAWEGSYFVGFSSLAHTAASSMCLICSLIVLNYNKDKFSWFGVLFLLILLYGIFETGARTFIIPALIFLYLYMTKNSKNLQLKYLIYALGLVVCIVILSKSSIMDKFNFASTINQYNKVNALTQQTSGRTEFWLIDLNGYLEGNAFDKLFGHGHGYTYYLNKTYYHLNVWAHNDFIQCLVGGGIITLLLYLFTLFGCSSKIVKKHKAMDKIVFFIYFFFPAFFNGLYNYPHYFLSFVIVCLMYDSFLNKNIEKVKL